MIKEPKIQGKDAQADKAAWLHDNYTLDARAFYHKERAAAQAALNSAAAVTEDPRVARLYEKLLAIEEILALLTYNEQNREDDD